MTREEINRSIKEVSIPLLVAVCTSIGVLLGICISTYQFATNDVQVASKKYRNILNDIDKEYADSVDIKELFESSMTQMLHELDPHSSYVPANDFLTKTSLDANFQGVGIRYIYLRDTLFVAESIKGGPAFDAGVLAGDRIIKVNDSNIVDLATPNTIYSLLRGEKGSEITTTIFRKRTNDTLNIVIKRGIIPNAAVDLSYMLDDENGYIKLNRFSFNSADEIRNKLVDLKYLGLKRLILDLRDNGGGLYHEAVAICDEFLSQGKEIVFTQARGIIKDKQKSEIIGEFEEGPLVVLINENSASASEIVSGALQDNDRAVIIGRRSFGKGLVQTPFSLFDNSELRLTTSRYYTPSGRCIQKPYDDEQYVSSKMPGSTSNSSSTAVYLPQNDSLKYHTANMRTVYGGGGIYPDVVVQKDTSLQNKVMAQLFAQRCFLEFAIICTQNGVIIENLDDFVKNFYVEDELLVDFYAFAESLGIKISKEQKLLFNELVKRELKIQIADAKWGALGMRKTLNLSDLFVIKALEILPNVGKILNPSI